MRNFAFIVTVLFFCGCGPSNWNILSKDIPQSQPTSNEPIARPTGNTQAQTPQIQAPSVDDEFVMIEEDLSDVAQKTQTKAEEKVAQSESDLFETVQTAENEAKEEVQKVKDEVAAAPAAATNAQNQYHISKIIEIWGEPNTTSYDVKNNKIYHWKNCKATGKTENRCDSNGNCEKVPTTSCCERKLRTNDAGYVQNLKEAIDTCK